MAEKFIIASCAPAEQARKKPRTAINRAPDHMICYQIIGLK